MQRTTRATKTVAAPVTLPAELAGLRQSIDNLDNALIALLAERYRVTERVGHLKAAHALPARDEAREAAQEERIRALAARCGLDPDAAARIHRLILNDVVRRHRVIARGG